MEEEEDVGVDGGENEEVEEDGMGAEAEDFERTLVGDIEERVQEGADWDGWLWRLMSFTYPR